MADYQTAQSVFAWGELQTNYTTEQSIDNDSFRLYEKEGYDKPVFSSPNVGNEGQATGSAYATRTSKDKDDVEFSGSERATFESIGFHAVGAFGVYNTPSVLTTGVYSHSFSLLSPFVSNTLPTRPLAVKVNEPALSANEILNVRFPSMMYESITFSNEGDNPNMMIDASWRGSGKRVIPSGVQFFGTGKDVKAPSGEHFVRKTAGVLTLNTAASMGGSDVSVGCSFRDATITVNNNLNTEAGYDGCALFQDDNPDMGAIRGSMKSGGQTVELAVTLLFTSDVATSFDPIGKLYSGADVSLELEWTGALITGAYNHKATFTLNKAKIGTVEFPDVTGGQQGIRLVFQPMAVNDAMPLTLNLVSDVADFNTFVAV